MNYLYAMIVFTALFCGSLLSYASTNENPPIAGQVVVVLDGGNQQATGKIISIDNRGVTVRLSNGKDYFYPMYRIFVVGEQ